MINFGRWGLLIAYAGTAALIVVLLMAVLPVSLKASALQDPRQMGLFGFDWNNWSTNNTVTLFGVGIYSLLQVLCIRGLISQFHVHVQTHPYRNINWGKELRNPSILFAVVIGLILLAMCAGIQVIGQLLVSSILGVNLLVLGACWVCWHVKSMSSEKEERSPFEEPDLVNLTTINLRNWLKDENPNGQVDYFNRTEMYVKRIHKRLNAGGASKRGQVIVGDQGSGKSAVIELVKARLGKEWIVATYGVWGSSTDQKGLIELILKSVLNQVGKHIEVTRIHSMPEEYIKAAYATKPWLSVLSLFQSIQSPQDVLSTLSTLLQLNDKYLVIIVEDIDRSPNEEEAIQHLSGFMDRISKMQNIRFIFTVSNGAKSTSEIVRVADYREDLAPINPEAILQKFYELCMQEAKDKNKVILYKGDTQDEWLFKGTKLSNQYSESKGKETPYAAMKNLLSNPRTLKAVLRRVHEAWSSLMGEVNLNDLLAYNTLRSIPELSDELDEFHLDELGRRRAEQVGNKDKQKDRHPLLSYLEDGVGGSSAESIDVQGVRCNKEGNTNNNRYLTIIMTETIPDGLTDQEVYYSLRSFFIGDMPGNSQAEYAKELLSNPFLHYRAHEFIRYLRKDLGGEVSDNAAAGFAARLCTYVQYEFLYQNLNTGHAIYLNAGDEPLQYIIDHDFKYAEQIRINPNGTDLLSSMLNQISFELPSEAYRTLEKVMLDTCARHLFQGLYLAQIFSSRNEHKFNGSIWKGLLNGFLKGFKDQDDLICRLLDVVDSKVEGIFNPLLTEDFLPARKVLTREILELPVARRIQGLRIVVAILRDFIISKKVDRPNIEIGAFKGSLKLMFESGDPLTNKKFLDYWNVDPPNELGSVAVTERREIESFLTAVKLESNAMLDDGIERVALFEGGFQ